MDLRTKKKIALVLSGGGVKAAAFHIGVCLALQEKGFLFAGGTQDEVQAHFTEDTPLVIRQYVGSSAGAVISALLAAGYSVSALIEAFEHGASEDLRRLRKGALEIHDRRLKPLKYSDLFHLNGGSFLGFVPGLLKRKSIIAGGIEAFLKSGFKINGIFTTKGIANYLESQLKERNHFQALGVELYIIATQLNHSRKAIFGAYPETTKSNNIKRANFATISEAVAASASLPPAFAPYPIPNQKGKTLYFFDGEIRDTLSTHVAADSGADLIISSYSIQPYHYTKEFGSLHEYGIPVIVNQALYQVVEQKIEKHRQWQHTAGELFHDLNDLAKAHNLSSEVREEILRLVKTKLNYRPHVENIYIHPSANDHEMFFADHFSLNSEVLAYIVQVGFRAAIAQLRHYSL